MKIQIPPYLTSIASSAAAAFAAVELTVQWPQVIAAEGALPMMAGLAALLLLCSISLVALELGQRRLAIAIAGLVAIAVTTTIASWVIDVGPPFNIFLFGAPNLEFSYFPSAAARDAAVPVALASFAIVLLAIDAAPSVMRPLSWAAGLMLVLTPILRYLASFVALDAFPQSDALGSTATIWIAVMLLGVALMQSRFTHASGIAAATTYRKDQTTHVRTAVNPQGIEATAASYAPAPIDWSARLRAAVVVIVLSITLTLWHTLRATEIRQLQEQVQTASRSVVTDWQSGVAERVRSTDRLGQHWLHLGWNIPTPVFLADSRAFMRDYAGIHGVLLTDSQGRIITIARRKITLGTAPTATDDVEIVAADSPGFPLELTDGGLKVARDAIAAKTRVRSGPATVNGITLLQSAAPAVDSTQQVVGALVLVFRRDINDAVLLENVARDFYLRVFTNGVLSYSRVAASDATATWPRPFSIREQVRVNSNDYVFEVAPSPSIIAHSLTWTPTLMLVFVWATLILLTFALYNERRAFALARDRQRILNESLDLICTLDTDGRYVTVNDTSYPVLGYLPQELLGHHYSEFVHPDEKLLLATQWQDAKKGNQPPNMPIRFLHKNGAVVYLQGNAHWSAPENLFYCDMRDVSEQHALELARNHAAKTLTTGVDQAGCVVYEFFYDTQHVTWVGAIRALTGYESNELDSLGFAGWMQAIHPDDRAHVRNTLRRCLESRQPHTIDYRLRRKDGEYVPVLDRGRHVEDATDSQPRMIGALIDLSTIRQQEHALRRSEERYRIIATQVGAVIIEREIATGRVRVFGPVEQIYGYTKEQIESRPYGPEDTMIHPDDRVRVNAMVAAAEQSLSSYYLEYRRRHRGGHFIHIASRGVVLPGVDGRADRAVIAVTDITERKLAEERLQESDERFRLAAEQAKQIVYEFVLGARLEVVELRFAGAAEQMLGYTVAELHELQSSDRFSLVHPDDIPAVRAAGSDMQEGSSQFTVEHRLRHRDGRYVYVEDRGAVRRDAQSNITGIVGMLLDITARKNAEAERHAYTTQLGKLADIARKVSTLLSLHELLNYLARSMRELIGVNASAVIVHDPSVTADRTSAVSFGEHYGLQRGDIVPFGSPELHELLAEDNHPVWLTAAQTRTDPRWSKLTQNDELQHPLRGWLATPLTTRDGERLGLLQLTDKAAGEFTDSDAQVLSQLAGLASVAVENIRLYATLEERVIARTRELQISNRELEAFSYSVSHDLRAPLRAIAGFSSILEQEYAPKLDATARRYLQRVSGGVERMANLIDDLLSLARVSRLDIKRENIDLTGLCRAIVKRQLERWPDRDLQIKIDPRLRVTADPRLVEVALENLVENAIKFTGKRAQSQIHIGKRSVNAKPAFFVHDNGVGFDPKYSANLFGVFQRLHSASEFPGTGVGLATVQRIMQRHHGRVWAESQIDQGATFYFTFDSEA